MFVDFFIRRPVFAGVFSILITLVGAIASPRCPSRSTPTWRRPGDRHHHLRRAPAPRWSRAPSPSRSSRSSTAWRACATSPPPAATTAAQIITITFEPDARHRGGRGRRAEPRQPRRAAPAGAGQPDRHRRQQGLEPAPDVAGLFSPDDRYDAQFLSNYADVNLKDALKRVRGRGRGAHLRRAASSPCACGWTPPSWPRRRLTAAGRGARAARAEPAGGRRAGGPAAVAPRTSPTRSRCAPAAAWSRPSEFGDIVVQRSADGSLVRLKDVGRVELGAENYEQLLRFNGHPGGRPRHLPAAHRQRARRARRGDRRAGAAGQATSPRACEFQPGTDTTLAVRASIDEVLKTLVEAIALVILVIFLFLHGWRSVLITALTLPVSLVGTFAFVKLFGFSINTLTLFGLTLATGLVVDDAIVVIENIERLMAAASSCRRCEAAARGHARGGRRGGRHLASCWWRCSCRWRSSPAPPAPSTASSRSPSPPRSRSPPSAPSP